MITNDIKDIEKCLIKCWSIKTSSKWTKENPYKGQCGVTAIVINDLVGGKILKTRVGNQWHYYNLINGERKDYTSKQFDQVLDYQDIESSWEEAFSDTNEFQYKELKGLMEKELFGIVSSSSAEHYQWADKCDGWHFLKTDNLSVIKEKMASGTEEKLHFHQKAQQFFYVLKGVATFELNGVTASVEENKGIYIKPGIKHKITNNTASDLEFLVISAPKSHGDRINVDENKK